MYNLYHLQLRRSLSESCLRQSLVYRCSDFVWCACAHVKAGSQLTFHSDAVELRVCSSKINPKETRYLLVRQKEMCSASCKCWSLRIGTCDKERRECCMAQMQVVAFMTFPSLPPRVSFTVTTPHQENNWPSRYGDYDRQQQTSSELLDQPSSYCQSSNR